MNIVCVSNHPGLLSFFFHLSKMIASLGLNIKMFLLNIDHPYAHLYDSAMYLKGFQKIWQIPDVLYEKNLAKGLGDLKNLQAAYAAFAKEFASLEGPSCVLLPNSASLPVNLARKVFAHSKRNLKVYRWGFVPEEKTYKIDPFRTLLANVYTLVSRAYSVVSIAYSGRKGTDFAYLRPCKEPYLFITEGRGGALTLPFPVETKQSVGKTFVFFGDTDFYSYYRKDIGEEDQFEEKLHLFFQNLFERFKDYQMWYKPHPENQGKLMRVAEKFPFKILDNSVGTSEQLLDTYRENIAGVFSLASTSSLSAAQRGIPGFFLYRLLVKEQGLRQTFDQQLEKSKLRFAKWIQSADDVGSMNFPMLDTHPVNAQQSWKYFLQTQCDGMNP